MTVPVSRAILSSLGDAPASSSDVRKDRIDDTDDSFPTLERTGIDISVTKAVRDLEARVRAQSQLLADIQSSIDSLTKTVSLILTAVTSPDEYRAKNLDDLTVPISKARTTPEAVDQSVASWVQETYALQLGVTDRVANANASTRRILDALEYVKSITPVESLSTQSGHTPTEVVQPVQSTPSPAASSVASTRRLPKVAGSTDTTVTPVSKAALQARGNVYAYTSRNDVIAALLLSVCENVKRRVESRTRIAMPSRSKGLFGRISQAVSVVCKVHNIDMQTMSDSGYTHLKDLLASPDRYPSRAISVEVYASICRSDPCRNVMRVVMAVVEKLRQLPEVFEPPGDYVIARMRSQLINERGDDFDIEGGVESISAASLTPIQKELQNLDQSMTKLYICARLAGFSVPHSLHYAKSLPQLRSVEGRYDVPATLYEIATDVRATLVT